MKEHQSLNEFQRELVRKAIDFTESTVTNTCRGRYQHLLPDIKQDAHLAVCKAALRFDPSLGIRFETYIYPFIIDSIRTTCHRYGTVIGYPPRKEMIIGIVHLQMRLDEDGDCLDDNIVGCVEDSREEIDRQIEEEERLTRLLKSLSRLEREILQKAYGLKGEKMTIRQIAKEMQLKPKRIMQLYNQALLKMEENSLSVVR